MTVHFISVGRSILDALKPPYDPFKREGGLREHVMQAGLLELVADRKPDALESSTASEWITAALALTPAAGRDEVMASALAKAADEARLEEWPAAVSAEAATFDRVPQVSRPLRSKDIAILLCSDTGEGLVAGLWNAVALTGGRPGKVTYLDSPTHEFGEIRGKALIVRVAGMDAADADGFAMAMGGLGTLARALLDSGQISEKEPFHFYLSGGFKAAIPYLIGLAEGLRSLNPDRAVQAFVLHESASREAPPIALPLRYIPARRVSHELDKYDENGVRKDVPDTTLLAGYAYEIRHGKCYLNAFGAGLEALFGLRTPGLGG